MKNRKRIVLRQLIRSLIVTRSSEFPVVALCFIAATTFWVLNALNKEYTTRISYPIQFAYDTSSIATKPLPKKISLNVTGYGWNLLRRTLSFTKEPITYPIDNPLRTSFLTASVLLPVVVNQLKEIKVNFVESDTIFTSFDTRTTKKVALKVDSSQISLRANHFIAAPIVLFPDSISFEGPISMLRKIPNELVINVPGDDLEDTYDDDIPITYIQSPLLKISSKTVNVHFDVTEFVRQQCKVPIEPINFTSEKGLRLPIREAEVTYWVLPGEVQKAEATAFKVWADFKTRNRQDSTLVLDLAVSSTIVKHAFISNPTVKLTR